MLNKHILYARRGIKATPIPPKCCKPPPPHPIFFHNVKRMFLFLYDNGTRYCKTLAYFITITKKKTSEYGLNLNKHKYSSHKDSLCKE